MSILVLYASKHGATQGIAERIGVTLTSSGQRVAVRPVNDAGVIDGYDAYVIGSAIYMGHWLKPAVQLVANHRGLLAAHPVWLFSSGPLGTERTDPEGKDLREASEPKETAELLAAIQPREHRGFFGALDPGALTLPERTLRRLPAARAIMPAGDFRDWTDIEHWARGIAEELTAGTAGKTAS
ncbi:MAG: flavodoxin domain-containing protein [Cellulomonas sp.]